MEGNKTVRISADTYEMIFKARGMLEAKNGKKRTIKDVIDYVLKQFIDQFEEGD